ncbi:hypothetical protein C2G38_2226620 [Gigaspora rosea]|uniref:Uncharacterized protein n=1 Tax=Gigaspora rosea TaxID=44941 RepID=A0A397U1G3_9GLOM|nr:hypothetical protein C2G38_2226620 [Gigaspora rosea]
MHYQIYDAPEIGLIYVKPISGFLDLQNNNRKFKSLGEEYSLSEQLKNFSSLVFERQISFIDEAFKNIMQSSLPQPIPITIQEEEAAKSKENMKQDDLLVMINSLLSSINISDCPKYCGLKQKNHSQ